MSAIEINGDNYTVSGTVVNAQTQNPIQGVEVHAFDKDLFRRDDELGHSATGADGAFSISFHKKDFADLFLDKAPDLYFEIIHDGVELHSTKDSHIRSAGPDTPPIIIPVDLPADTILTEATDQTSAPGPTTWQQMKEDVADVQAYGETIFALDSNSTELWAYDGTWINTSEVAISINNSINKGKNYLLAPRPGSAIYQSVWKADELNEMHWSSIDGSDVVNAQHSSLGTCYINTQGAVFIFDGPTWRQIASNAKELYVRETGIFIIDSESNLQVLCISGQSKFDWILVKNGVSSVDAGRVTYCIGNDVARTVSELFIGNTADPNNPQASAYIDLCTGAHDLAVMANEPGTADDLYIINKHGEVQWFERESSSLKNTAAMPNSANKIYAQGKYLYAIDDQNKLYRNPVNPQPPAKRAMDWTLCGEGIDQVHAITDGQSSMQMIGMSAGIDACKWAGGTTWNSLEMENQDKLSEYHGEAIIGGQDGVHTLQWTSESSTWLQLGNAEEVAYVGIGETGKYYSSNSGVAYVWDDGNKTWNQIPNPTSSENGQSSEVKVILLYITNRGAYMVGSDDNLYVYDSKDFPVAKKWTLIAKKVDFVAQNLDVYTASIDKDDSISKMILPQGGTTLPTWEKIGTGGHILACGQDDTMVHPSGQLQDMVYNYDPNSETLSWYNYVSKSWETLTGISGMGEFMRLNADLDLLVAYNTKGGKVYYTNFIWNNPPTAVHPTVTPAS